jgi:hypothetical protein
MGQRQRKNSETCVKNIIININNPINNIHTSQHIPVNINNFNNQVNQYDYKKTEMNGINENSLRINDKVLEARQTEFFISINRLLTSSICSWIYLLCFISCALLSFLSLVDIIFSLFQTWNITIFLIQILFMVVTLIDSTFKFMVMVKIIVT